MATETQKVHGNAYVEVQQPVTVETGQYLYNVLLGRLVFGSPADWRTSQVHRVLWNYLWRFTLEKQNVGLVDTFKNSCFGLILISLKKVCQQTCNESWNRSARRRIPPLETSLRWTDILERVFRTWHMRTWRELQTNYYCSPCGEHEPLPDWTVLCMKTLRVMGSSGVGHVNLMHHVTHKVTSSLLNLKPDSNLPDDFICEIQWVFRCETGSYSVPSRSRLGVFVKGEDPTMQDGPGLTPVLPVQQQDRQSAPN